MTNPLEQTSKLITELRKRLGSLSIEDLKNLDKPMLTDVELNARAGDTEIFYKNHFKQILELLIYKQQIAISDTAQTIEQVALGRGTINGLYLIQEWFEEQIGISMSRFDKEEKSEPGEIV